MSSSLNEGKQRQARWGRSGRARTPGNEEEGQSVASAPAEIHLRYEEEEDERHRRRRQRIETVLEEDEHQDNPPNSISLQDQIAASALSGTIEFLRLAGGLTLNATGKVVAPPLHVTRTVLLPALWAATLDYLSSRTPKRAKDWLRICGKSVHHFISVLKDTAKGELFRQRLLIFGGDLLDCLSADTTRQVLVDGMAGFVKLIEALNTPEAKAVLDQGTVLACRLTQVAASGRSQQAIHDATALLWSGVELLADPQSTTALAEVTAYLCHALEMEDAIMDGAFEPKSQRSERRKERDEYQKQTYREKTTLITDPEATVEEVILSSLGGFANSDLPGCDESDAFSSQGPYSETAGSDNRLFTDESGSLRKQVDESSIQTDDEWLERAKSNVDVKLLQRKIKARAEARANQNDWIPCDVPPTPPEDGDVGSNPLLGLSVHSTLQSVYGTDAATADEVENDENPMSQFYKTLDTVIKEKRAEGLDHILAEYSESTQKVLREGKVHKMEKRRVEGDRADIVADSIRARLAAIRADVNKGLSKDDREKLSRMETMMKRNSRLVYGGMALIVGFVLLWIVMGFYGLYAFLSPASRNKFSMSPRIFSGTVSGRTSSESEIVIRLVREVVHVDNEGSVLHRTPDQTEISRERMEKIAACMSDSLD